MNTPTILVVDDTLDLLDLYSIWLREAGYRVLQASTGRDCLRIVSVQRPDLVLLDVMLPDLNGVEVCKVIKSQELTAAIPVIHISGMRISEEHEAEGLEAGADGYLTKPFQARTLLAHVKALLRLKQTEEALQATKEQFKAAFENALDAILIADDQANYVDANPSACEIFGASKEDILRRNLSDFVAPGLHSEMEQVWKSFIEAGEQSGDFLLYRPDGTTRLLEYRAKANFLPNRHLSVLRDVTEREKAEEELRLAHAELEKRVAQRTAELVAANAFLKQEIAVRRRSEEALQQTEEKYRGIFENALEGIFQSTPGGEFISANPAMARIFGYDSPAELIADRRDIERQHYVEPARRAVFKQLIAAKGVVENFELQAYRKDGSKIWTSENVRAVYDANGIPIYYEGIVEDVTERKRSEEMRQLLSSIVESSRDGIVGFSADGKIVSWNAGAEKIFGYSEAEVKGRDISIFLPDGTTRDSLPFFKVVETGESNEFEVVRMRKDGTSVELSITTSPIKVGDKVIGVSSTVRDIGDRKRTEQMRNQLLQRLVTTQEDERRRLSRELHDQMGQSLAALMLGLKSIENSVETDSTASDALKKLQDQTNKLAQEVHTLARNLRPTALDDFGLNTALSNYVEEWSERTQIAADLHSNGLLKQRLPAPIETAVYRIVQEALTNILKHARAQNVSVIVEYRSDRVQVIIEDDGCGFDAEVMRTALAKDRRLGLLGMGERIALVGGTFNIESAPGVGTTVLAHIPVLRDSLESKDS